MLGIKWLVFTWQPTAENKGFLVVISNTCHFHRLWGICGLTNKLVWMFTSYSRHFSGTVGIPGMA